MSTRAASVFMPTCILPFITSAGVGILAGLMVATSNAHPPAGGFAATAGAGFVSAAVPAGVWPNAAGAAIRKAAKTGANSVLSTLCFMKVP